MLVSGLLISLTTNVFANTGAAISDDSLTEEQIQVLYQESSVKDQKLQMNINSTLKLEGDLIVPMGDLDGETYTISVTNYAQENGYYCGPASVRQSLSFHKAKSGSSTALPSQTTLANLVGTTSSGSTTTGLRTAINNYQSIFGWF